MIEGCDARESCAAVAFFAEPLGAAGMDQVAEFSGESGFGERIGFDNSKIACDFGVLVQDPFFEICWRLFGKCLVRNESRHGRWNAYCVAGL